MTILGARQTGGKMSAGSGNIYVALLTVLLLLSPHTARAVAQVLTQNGVALPAHVVRVLDALPADQTGARDTVRREEEAFAATVADDDVRHEPAPETVAVRVAVASAFLPSPPCPLPLQAGEGGVSEAILAFDLPRDASPRAPPA